MEATKKLCIRRDRRELRFQLGDMSDGPVDVALADRLRELIQREEFKTGDLLPDELEFAERLNVGRDPIRRALHTLEAERRLQGRDGWGWFVA